MHVVSIKVLISKSILEKVLLFIYNTIKEELIACKLIVLIHESSSYPFMSNITQKLKSVSFTFNAPCHYSFQNLLCIMKIILLVHKLNQMVNSEFFKTTLILITILVAIIILASLNIFVSRFYHIVLAIKEDIAIKNETSKFTE